MNEALKYVVVLFLSVGVFFLTTDTEPYFGCMDNYPISQLADSNASAGIEHSDSQQHPAEDLFSETGNLDFLQEGISLKKAIFCSLSFKNRFITTIWQPPKFS